MHDDAYNGHLEYQPVERTTEAVITSYSIHYTKLYESRQISLGGETITITGIAKGSGMIRPDMATMLAFIATDASVDSGALQQCLSAAVAKSFNRITVDGDTSTNDACVLVATAASTLPVLQLV